MKITKDSEQIVSIRKTTEYQFTITNDKGEDITIEMAHFVCDDDSGIDSEDTYYDENEKLIEDIEEFMDKHELDWSEVSDEINELI
jgi:hypothetical protein